MRMTLRLLIAAIALAAPLAAVADARSDLSIRTQEDAEHYTIYKLVNDGDAPIKATVQLTKQCSGVSGEKQPKPTEHWLKPKSEIELGRAWPQSTCRRDYRIVAAEYI